MQPAKKIVIIDTDTEVLNMLSINLKVEGYELKLARSGKNALEIAQSFFPDLIVTELLKITSVLKIRKLFFLQIVAKNMQRLQHLGQELQIILQNLQNLLF